MYIPRMDDVPTLFNMSIEKPSQFSLDMSGVLAGLFGGDNSVSAMATVHIYGNRRWLGWYNTPGSFQIASRFHSFAKSFSRSGDVSPVPLSQGIHTDPATLFELGNCKGPKFRAAHSGTVIQETGYMGTLFMKECASWKSEGNVVPGRKTQPVSITIAELGVSPAPEMHPTRSSASSILFAGIPISISVATCAICALHGDLYASSLIFVGIIASGVSCFVLGSTDFVFTHPVPAKGSPAGDGILTSDKDIVLLKGTESAVNSITRGSFSLRFSSERHYNLVRWCSVLFFVQCITQLLLIPQASLFGQVMFLVSLGVSALYNARISCLDKEKIHRILLFESVLENPRVTKYTLGTRTTAVVFMLLVLKLRDPTALLDELLPNDTKVWRRWKATIIERLRLPYDQTTFLPETKVGHLDGFMEDERILLEHLYGDARAAYNGYKDYVQSDSL